MVGARSRVGDHRGKVFWNLRHTAWWLEQRSTPLEEWELGLGFESEEQRWRQKRKRKKEKKRKGSQEREKILKKSTKKIKNANYTLTLTKNQFNHLRTIASNSTFSINPQHLEFMVTIYYTKKNMIHDI